MSSRLTRSVLHDLDLLFSEGSSVVLSDKELVDRFVRYRDERAFRSLVSAHGPMVLGVCRRVLTRPEDVDDAFQATFLVFLQKARTLRDPSTVGGWLHGVAIKIATRRRKDLGRKRDIAAMDRGEQGDISANSDQETLAIIDEELAKLPAIYREPIVLCHVEGNTHDQAAARLGCPVGTVRSRLSRGRERLRSQLTRRGLAPESGIGQLTIAPMGERLLTKVIGLLAGPTAVAPKLTMLTQGVLTTMFISSMARTGLIVLISAAGVSSSALIGAGYFEQKERDSVVMPKSENQRGDAAISGVGDTPVVGVAGTSPQAQATKDEIEEAKVEVRIKQAHFKIAKEQRDQAAGEVEVYEKLAKQSAVSKEEMRKSYSDLKIADGKVEAAGADLAKAELTLRLLIERLQRLNQPQAKKPTRGENDQELPKLSPPVGVNPFGPSPTHNPESLSRRLTNLKDKMQTNEASAAENDAIKAEIKQIDAEIADEIQVMQDYIEMLKIELVKKEAEENIALEKKAAASSLHEITKTQKANGSLGYQEVAKAEGEMKYTAGMLEVAQADVAKAKLAIKHSESRLSRLVRITEPPRSPKSTLTVTPASAVTVPETKARKDSTPPQAPTANDPETETQLLDIAIRSTKESLDQTQMSYEIAKLEEGRAQAVLTNTEANAYALEKLEKAHPGFNREKEAQNALGLYRERYVGLNEAKLNRERAEKELDHVKERLQKLQAIRGTPLELPEKQPSQPQPSTATPVPPGRPAAVPVSSAPIQSRSPVVFRLELKRAAKELADNGGDPAKSLDAAAADREIETIQTEIVAEVEQINEQIEHLKAELAKKQAELMLAQAKRLVPQSKLTTVKQLVENKTVSTGELKLSEQELAVADGVVDVAKADMNRTEVAIKLAEKKMQRLQAVLDDFAKTAPKASK